MKPSPEIEAQGLKAYEQARAYERVRSWRLPLVFTFFPLLALVMCLWLWRLGDFGMAWANFGIAFFLAGLSRFQWKQLAARHARNLRLLAQLKDQYGDELSWVQVEKHFAELEELKRELARERK